MMPVSNGTPLWSAPLARHAVEYSIQAMNVCA